MSKKSLIVLVVSAFAMSLALGVTISFAVDKGPAEITLNPDGTKPVMFPHAKHQEKNACGACHHTAADGKAVPVGDDAAQADFQKCDACHNADFANEKLRTWKDIGHGRCKACHTEMKDKGAPTKCNDCHIKKEG